jgi:hypothetical protein
MNKWINILKKLKEEQIKSKEGPDIPYIIHVEKEGIKGITISISNKTSNPKYESLQVASLLQKAIDPDLIIFISDGYLSFNKTLKEEETPSEKFERGDINARETLICVSIDRNKKPILISLPYAYEDGIIIWEELQPESMEIAGGFIPESLIKIMNQTPINKHPIMQIAQFARLSPEKRLYHQTRAVMHILHNKGFTITEEE